MVIFFIDEYEENIYNSSDVEFPIVPTIGDIVNFGSEDWYVKNRVFNYDRGIIIIHVSQQVGNKISKIKEDTTRHDALGRSIIELSKKQALIDKKVRSVTEQTEAIRNYINQSSKERKHDT